MSQSPVDPSSYAISIFGRHDKDGDGSLNRTAPQWQLQLLLHPMTQEAPPHPGARLRPPRSHRAGAVQPQWASPRTPSRELPHLPQLQEATALIDDFCKTLGLDLAAREKDNLINQQARGW